MALRSGYRVAVTMPPDLPEGPLAEWIELVGASHGGNGDRTQGAGGKGHGVVVSGPGSASEAPETLRIPIHGSVHGRLELHSPKLLGTNLLLWGTLREGQPAHETIFLKLNDDRRQLSVRRIETEPAFLRASLAPYRAEADRAGFYRIDLELPADSPSSAFTAPHRGWVRLRTDHPRLPLIEVKVDFCIVARLKRARDRVLVTQPDSPSTQSGWGLW